MSTQTLSVCDFCGKDVGDLEKIEFTIGTKDGDVETIYHDPKDICADCRKRLEAFLQNGCRQPRKRSEKKKDE